MSHDWAAKDLRRVTLTLRKTSDFETPQATAQRIRSGSQRVSSMPRRIGVTGVPRNPAQTDKDGPVISVIIPHYNDLENLDRCLRALQSQTVDSKTFEVIVADNNSRCDRAHLDAICQDRCRLVLAPIQGAAEARNAGVRASRARLLAFIDSDCRAGPDWLEKGLDALRSAALVGGRVDVAVDDPAAMTPTEAFERVYAFNNERYVTRDRFSVTANLFTSRAVFDDVGDFRAGVSEDRDWGHRAAARGHTWHYATGAAVEHPARRDWNELTRKWRRLTIESFRLLQASGRGRTRWILRNWAMLLSLPLALAPAILSRRVARLADRMKAVGVLARLRWWRFVEAHRVAFVR